MKTLAIAWLVIPSWAWPQSASDSLRVLDRSPVTRGRYLCGIDSVAASIGDRYVRCRVGGDTTFIIRRDTISAVTRPSGVLLVSDSLTLFDHWNRAIRREWVRRFGAPPTDIGMATANENYFEAVWDRTTGVREIISLTRIAPGRVAVSWGSYDCRPTAPVRAMACR